MRFNEVVLVKIHVKTLKVMRLTQHGDLLSWSVQNWYRRREDWQKYIAWLEYSPALTLHCFEVCNWIQFWNRPIYLSAFWTLLLLFPWPVITSNNFSTVSFRVCIMSGAVWDSLLWAGRSIRGYLPLQPIALASAAAERVQMQNRHWLGWLHKYCWL